jgi:hypothetical protein
MARWSPGEALRFFDPPVSRAVGSPRREFPSVHWHSPGRHVARPSSTIGVAATRDELRKVCRFDEPESSPTRLSRRRDRWRPARLECDTHRLRGVQGHVVLASAETHNTEGHGKHMSDEPNRPPTDWGPPTGGPVPGPDPHVPPSGQPWPAPGGPPQPAAGPDVRASPPPSAGTAWDYPGASGQESQVARPMPEVTVPGWVAGDWLLALRLVSVALLALLSLGLVITLLDVLSTIAGPGLSAVDWAAAGLGPALVVLSWSGGGAGAPLLATGVVYALLAYRWSARMVSSRIRVTFADRGRFFAIAPKIGIIAAAVLLTAGVLVNSFAEDMVLRNAGSIGMPGQLDLTSLVFFTLFVGALVGLFATISAASTSIWDALGIRGWSPTLVRSGLAGTRRALAVGAPSLLVLHTLGSLLDSFSQGGVGLDDVIAILLDNLTALLFRGIDTALLLVLGATKFLHDGGFAWSVLGSVSPWMWIALPVLFGAYLAGGVAAARAAGPTSQAAAVKAALLVGPGVAIAGLVVAIGWAGQPFINDIIPISILLPTLWGIVALAGAWIWANQQGLPPGFAVSDVATAGHGGPTGAKLTDWPPPPTGPASEYPPAQRPPPGWGTPASSSAQPGAQMPGGQPTSPYGGAAPTGATSVPPPAGWQRPPSDSAPSLGAAPSSVSDPHGIAAQPPDVHYSATPSSAEPGARQSTTHPTSAIGPASTASPSMGSSSDLADHNRPVPTSGAESLGPSPQQDPRHPGPRASPTGVGASGYGESGEPAITGTEPGTIAGSQSGQVSSGPPSGEAIGGPPSGQPAWQAPAGQAARKPASPPADSETRGASADTSAGAAWGPPTGLPVSEENRPAPTTPREPSASAPTANEEAVDLASLPPPDPQLRSDD